jgi:hypothetical protein
LAAAASNGKTGSDKSRAKAATQSAATPAGAAGEFALGAAAQMQALQARLGNASMHSFLRGIQAQRAAADVGELVHRAIARPGAAPDAATASRLGGLLGAGGIAPALRQASSPGNQPVWVAHRDSEPEVAARLAVEKTIGAGRPLRARSKSQDLPVRIHTDAAADAAARALGARAFAAGEHVVFRSGSYAPHTPQGERLLLHELVHVQQAPRHPAGLLVLREGEEWSASVPEASAVTMAATLDGLWFDFGNRRYREGPTRAQLWPLILQRLLGTQYSDALVDEIFARWQARTEQAGLTLQMFGPLEAASTADAGERIGRKYLGSGSALMLVYALEAGLGLRADLSEQQRELLLLGYALESAWELFRARFPEIPQWYTEPMFQQQMRERAGLLRDWQTATCGTSRAATSGSRRRRRKPRAPPACSCRS